MQLLTVPEVQARLNVSRTCVYRLISQGDLPCIRIGIGRGTIRVEEADLEAFIKRCRTATSKPRLLSFSQNQFQHLDSERLRNAWRDETPPSDD